MTQQNIRYDGDESCVIAFLMIAELESLASTRGTG